MMNSHYKYSLASEMIGLGLTIPYVIYVVQNHLNMSELAFFLRIAPLVFQVILVIWTCIRYVTSDTKAKKFHIALYILCLVLYSFTFAFGITEVSRGACNDFIV